MLEICLNILVQICILEWTLVAVMFILIYFIEYKKTDTQVSVIPMAPWKGWFACGPVGKGPCKTSSRDRSPVDRFSSRWPSPISKYFAFGWSLKGSSMFKTETWTTGYTLKQCYKWLCYTNFPFVCATKELGDVCMETNRHTWGTWMLLENNVVDSCQWCSLALTVMLL